MKKYPLTHPTFDGMISDVLSRRAVLNALIEGRHVFETPLKRKVKEAKKYAIFALILAIGMLSAWTISRDQAWDLSEKVTIHNIYRGSAAQVAENKKKAFQQIGVGNE